MSDDRHSDTLARLKTAKRESSLFALLALLVSALYALLFMVFVFGRDLGLPDKALMVTALGMPVLSPLLALLSLLFEAPRRQNTVLISTALIITLSTVLLVYTPLYFIVTGKS